MTESFASARDAADALRAAIARHREGDHTAAEQGYRAHLEREPNDPSALHFLGLLRSHQGRNREAIVLMLQALEANPEYVDAWSNLSIAFFQERDLERSEKCCRRALELAPEFVNAWANLGKTLYAKDAAEEALRAWDRALELDPTLRSVAIPYGQVLYKLNRTAEAREFYSRWNAASPDDPIAQHMLAAVGGAEVPERASDAYVRSTFDSFADSFDRKLETLHYRAPQLLCDAIAASALRPEGTALDVLDLGCGTGLCGPLLRSQARRLVGVDLSSMMLSKAAARGVYDQLNRAELTAWLVECGQRFDVAVAADVLCYFGDLSSVFTRVRETLTPRGCFACSLEALPADRTEVPFVLREHGRYQHAEGYVRAMLAKAGFVRVELSQAHLRYERQEPVAGHLIIAALDPSSALAAPPGETTSSP
ncbi:MAG TPA: tetratricopeptide repeat protein [Steroidobacteraceae bacterium]|nr:tetratricopeptide repeat protein [Steroidobacteraceae bacterium]